MIRRPLNFEILLTHITDSRQSGFSKTQFATPVNKILMQKKSRSKPKLRIAIFFIQNCSL